ncbi:MAG: radical SAM protein [Thermodesulfobacteriota bacterium]
MMYEHPPYRPPSEAGSILFRVTRGCPWNQCTFCSMYKGSRFERRPVEDVIQDIKTAGKFYRHSAPTIFLGDSNSLILDPDALKKILTRIYQNFPDVQRVTSYARARTLGKMKMEDLQKLRAAGLTRLHVGLETGDPELLLEIRKGATPEQMVAGCRRAKEAGFEVSLYVLAGIGGQERWQQHAEGTADVLNRVNPDFIRIRTFVPTPLSELWDKVETGAFAPASPETILRELQLLIERLDVASEFLSDHISNYVPVNGKLPEDKNRMLAIVRQALAALENDAGYRRRLERIRRLTRL